MYIAVCDDHIEELKAIESLLELWQKERKVVLRYKLFQSASAMLDAASKERFTLYFLDVMMPGLDGLDAAREIRSFDDTADIAFLTSTPGFAYESYSVHALDYLLKPISEKLLFPIIDQLYQKENKPSDSLTLKCGATLVRVPFSQLSYVEVIGKHLYFNLADGTMRQVNAAMNEYEGVLLSRPEFMRIHRSYIVNMLHVDELSSSGLHTFSGKKLPVSRLLYPQLQKDYMKLLFSEE
ncbi:MAG: response regulator transcription factor [Oscillospiraceae bacterium]|nr:response regulator transcription factor [Oscillospiraceae bacterium]